MRVRISCALSSSLIEMNSRLWIVFCIYSLKYFLLNFIRFLFHPYGIIYLSLFLHECWSVDLTCLLHMATDLSHYLSFQSILLHWFQMLPFLFINSPSALDLPLNLLFCFSIYMCQHTVVIMKKFKIIVEVWK